ncbi:MAG: folate-binding protein [Rhodobacteraceae bacterium]|nr:folate-binding protein [Paracoccaceae bacterium]
MPTSTNVQSRTVLEITGEECRTFLQRLVTNDVDRLDDGPVYSALLTPQGKFLVDFMLLKRGDGVLVDVHSGCAKALEVRLGMYRLRSRVEIRVTGLTVSRGLGDAPTGAVADPRHPAMGWRAYGDDDCNDEDIDWDAIRVDHCIPETLIELIPNKTYVLEAGFERLQGVDFKKGCFVGQEVTARMKHKARLRKGLAKVRITGSAPLGTSIRAGRRLIGTLYTQSGGHAIAQVRFDRLGDTELRAGDAVVEMEANG